MTLEQLLSPAVFDWYSTFLKKMNESNTKMTSEQMEKEFDNWLISNESLVNKSVEDNMDEINESINVGISIYKSLNEGLFDDDMFAEDGDDDVIKPSEMDDEEDEPITGEVEGEEEEGPSEISKTMTGAIRLSNSETNPKNNVFVAVNALYDRFKKKGVNDEPNSIFYRKLNMTGVQDMTALFAFTNIANADLSSFDTSNVKHMEGMFYKSTYNNDSCCGWNVSSCKDFKNMFSFSKFNHSLKKWTPAFTEVNERDADGRVMRDADGKPIKKSVRADLPLIGAAADEETEILVKHWNDIFDDIEKEEISMKESKFNHVMDFDTFINEGKFKDFINKGVDKIKSVFKSVALKFGDIVAFFKENGEMYPATSAYTSLNAVANGEIPGVTAFCNVKNNYLNPAVNQPASIVESPEYYGIIKKDSVEYRNYQTFKGMIEEHYDKYGDLGCLQMLNEENYKRVGFSAASGGVNSTDIDSDDLREILNDVIKNVPAYKGDKHGGAVLIWGAPGIGKSSIPKSIVKSWNEKQDDFHKKALMVIECGDLTIDGFSLPIPVDKSIAEYLDERPKLNSIIQKSGVSSDVIENIKKSMHKVSIEAPKTWLPAFKMTSNQEEVNILNDIANGHLELKNKDGVVTVTETTEGGILLMDEFFRADENIFKILMQLLLNRTYSGYMLGNKWGILCCSNRPNDDEEVDKGFSKTGAVVGTRMLAGAYNFIPSFTEWKKWAIKEGGFDDITLEFLMFDKNDEGEYTNWHTIRPTEYTATGKTAWPTPRTWSALMTELNLYMENHGYSDVTEIPERKLRLKADGIIGEEMSKRYVSFLNSHSKTNINVKKIMSDPSYTIPSDAKCSDVCRRLENHIKITYSDDNLPEISSMMNMFNNIDKTYAASKDNIVKTMHVNIIKHFNIMTNKAARIAMKDYIQAAEKRYGFEPADFK